MTAGSAPVTRFAPSPTGYLHIGGARTALFNWLYARASGGRMVLRIEDTDRERSTEAAYEAIVDGLRWLGLDWDGDVVSQHSRADRHREVAEQLLAAGKAYRCYADKTELDEMRAAQRAAKQVPRYDGRWRDRDPSEAPVGSPYTIRIKAPQAGTTVIEDAVQGKVTFPNADIDDFVLLRADGAPTYMLAVVVDDHDMGVTQVIRGDDHLTNAARQKVIYDAMGWEQPGMAHIPLIHGSDGAKLSKRHGALGVEAYRAMGYLPEALRNYLVRLGWSHGDEEYFSDERLLDLFSLEAIGRSASRFDFTKLENMNGHYIRSSEDGDLVNALRGLLPHIEQGAWFEERWTAEREERLRALMPGLKERAKTLVELLEGAKFLFEDRPLVLDEKASALLSGDDGSGRAHLLPLHERLAALETWALEDIEQAVRSTAEARGAKLGKIAQPLRAALTGRTQSPGIFEVVHVLGRDEALGRIQDCLPS